MRVKRTPAVIAGASVLALTFGVAAPSIAAESDDAPIIEELLTAAPSLEPALAPASATVSEVDGVTAEITEQTISVASDVGEFTLTAPAETAESSVESVLLDEASALFAIRLASADAPRTYDFVVDLPTDAVVTQT